MLALTSELATSRRNATEGSTGLNSAERIACAAAHAAAGEAWFALHDSKRALAEFEVALHMLGRESPQSPASEAMTARAQCGLGKCLVDLQRQAEAVPALDASVHWYSTSGDPNDEAQESLLSQALHTLGLAHAERGDYDRALEATARALQMRRRLADSNLERYRPALSRTLRNFGNWLNEVGRHEEALQAHEEMLELRRVQWRIDPSVSATLSLAEAADATARQLVEGDRELANAIALASESATLYLELQQTYPDRFALPFERQADYLIALADRFIDAGRLEMASLVAAAAVALSRQYRSDSERLAPKVAATLGRLSLALREKGHRGDALRIAQEALELHRELAAGNRDAFLPDLATSLNNVGISLSEAGGRCDEALRAVEEALTLRRELVARNRALLPDLAKCLNNLGVVLGETTRHHEALAVAEEAVSLYRQLAARERDSFVSDLATSLNNLGTRLSEVNRREEALDAAREALELRRELLARDREVFLPDLAESLSSLGNALSEAGRRGEALAMDEEALYLYRELVARKRSGFLRGLAGRLNNLGISLGEAGRRDEALSAAKEALELYRELAAGDRDAFLPDLAMSLNSLGNSLGEAGLLDDALAAAEEALQLRRELVARNRDAFLPGLATSLNNLGITLSDVGRRDDALRAAKEALELYRELVARNRDAFLPGLAIGLSSMSNMLGEAGRRDAALVAAEEALKVYRELAARNREAFLPDLAIGLSNLSNSLGEAGFRDAALFAAEEALELRRELVARNRNAFLPDLAMSLSNLSIRLSEAGWPDKALVAAEEAAELCRELVARDRDAFLPDLTRSLNNLSGCLSGAGRRAEALRATEETLELRRELVARNGDAFLPDLALSLNKLSADLGRAGRHDEAVAAGEEALELVRELATRNREAFLPDLAMSLSNLGSRLGETGRRDEALTAVEEALGLRRELVARNRGAFLPDLATNLNNLSISLIKVGCVVEARRAAEEALRLLRELVDRNRDAFLPNLAVGLCTLGNILGDAGQHDAAVDAAEEALLLNRELASRNRDAFLPDLATSLSNLGIALSVAGRHGEVVAVAEEALRLHRELTARNRDAFLPGLATSLNNLGISLSEDGRRAEAIAAFRECGTCVLQLRPHDPYLWSRLISASVEQLDAPEDLRDFHLRLIGLLTEHRELAWNNAHAQAFLDLQAQVAARVWNILANLPADESTLLDEAVAALVATLQSPDLARWVEIRGSGDGPLAKLAELKREVIEAEQLLAALRNARPSGGASGLRDAPAEPRTDSSRRVMTDDIEREFARSQMLRQAFRDERTRLIAEDPSFAAAFETLGPRALRSLARHARGGALLCVLHLGASASPDTPLAERSRMVAALLHADGQPTQLLELAGAWEAASYAEHYQPEEHGVGRRGPLRGAPPASAYPASDSSPLPPSADLLAQRMTSSFWEPLRRALQRSGVIERVHVCLHGTSQQLPLATRTDRDCPGTPVVAWPGLPYLRTAASSTPSAIANDELSPWLVGHDCAWESEQPLPMVAVEAALLRTLLSEHGQPVRAVNEAARLHDGASAFVACCHGGAERAQFDHALHLGHEPLTVRQILQRRIGPPLVLLPACYAGRTDEDAAGNALGVAAAFMLSGTKVVVASSKAVPDLLQPWLSTLMVWHAMQGRANHEAAHIAREQFARLHFPVGYRSWLQAALPQALATIQPGGEEDQSIRGPRAQLAMETVARCWPWEGETKHLFSADTHLRTEATRSVVAGILNPRASEQGKRDLVAEAREVAAFVFVYGVD